MTNCSKNQIDLRERNDLGNCFLFISYSRQSNLFSTLPVRVINLYLNNVGNLQHLDLKGSFGILQRITKASEKKSLSRNQLILI